MNEIKRYRNVLRETDGGQTYGDIRRDVNGDLVLYSDVEPILADLAAARAEINGLYQGALNREEYFQSTIGALQEMGHKRDAENERLNQISGTECPECHWAGDRGNGCEFCALREARAEIERLLKERNVAERKWGSYAARHDRLKTSTRDARRIERASRIEEYIRWVLLDNGWYIAHDDRDESLDEFEHRHNLPDIDEETE